MVDLGLVLQGATVELHDPSGDGQTKTRPVVLRSEKWIEEPFFHLRWDTLSRIRDFKHYDVGLSATQPLAVRPGAQGNRVAAADAVRGVLYQVDQHLLDLCGVCSNAQRIMILPQQLDVRLCQLG